MTNTQISLQLTDGVIVPSQGSIPVNEGATVTFVNPSSSTITLFFSPAVISALTPAPSTPTTLESGAKTEYAFTTSNPGAYSVFFGLSGSSAPAVFPTDPSTVLSLQVAGSGVSFGGFNNKTTTGY